MKYTSISRLTSCAVLSLALASAGCGHKSAAPAAPVSEVTVVHPLEKDIQEWDTYTGRLKAPDTVEIRARVGGYLESIHFKDGSVVKKGDLLFVIDPRPYQASLDGAKASLVQAEAQLALAQTNLNRSQDLRKKQVVAQEDLDTQINDYKGAQAGVSSAQASVQTAQLNLDFTQVRAPVSGRVSRYAVSVGNLISGGSDSSTLLTTITSLDPIYAYFEVDEQSFLKYSAMSAQDGAGNTRAELELSDEKDFPHKGEIDFVDNQVDSATATMQLRGVFANPDLRLTPGLFARIRIPGHAAGKGILLPDQAIGSDQNVQYVLAVGPDNKAIYKGVETGPIVDGLRVIRRGITAEDRVIAIGMQRARPGATVKPVEKTVEEVAAGMIPAPVAPK